MRVEKDFAEFIELLNTHQVEYMIVGAFALAVHTRPRATGDIDFFVSRDPENANRLLQALADFGFGSLGLSEKDLTAVDTIIQLGREPVRIDIITSISGVEFGEAYPNAITAKYGGTEARFISFEDLMTNKRASGRKQDLADLDVLERFKAAR